MKRIASPWQQGILITALSACLIQAASASPQITSVQFAGSASNYTLTVTGSGFGTYPGNLPFTGDSSYFYITVLAQQWDSWQLGSQWGASGDALGLTYNSWSDTQIVVSGFECQPGYAIYLCIMNPSSGLSATWGGNVPGVVTPQITAVTFSGSGQNLQIIVQGSGFGNAPVAMPFTGNLNYFAFVSPAVFWAGGGCWGQGSPCSVTLNYQSWSDTEIVINGFAGSYGQGGATLQSGDPVDIVIWNSGDTDYTGPQTAWGGFATETAGTPTITSVNVGPASGGNLRMSIQGSGFGTNSPYTTTSSFLRIYDQTQDWNAGFTGDWVDTNVVSWTDTNILINGFTGQYNQYVGYHFNPGDQLQVFVENPQTQTGFVTSPVTLNQTFLEIDIQPPSHCAMVLNTNELTDLQSALLSQLQQAGLCQASSTPIAVYVVPNSALVSDIEFDLCCMMVDLPNTILNTAQDAVEFGFLGAGAELLAGQASGLLVPEPPQIVKYVADNVYAMSQSVQEQLFTLYGGCWIFNNSVEPIEKDASACPLGTACV